MNILLIYSDQQHKYSLGKISPQFITPNLDALADDGVLFRNGYSNNPVCGPYRGCLMTGLYTSHCRVYENCAPLPDFAPTVAQSLNEAGYSTAYVGKWHLGGNGNTLIPKELRGGFEHFIGYQCYNGYDPNPPFCNDVCFFDENDLPHRYAKHRTDVTTDLAIDKIAMLSSSDKPFFVTVSYQAPHYPEQPSAEYASLYKDIEFTKTPDFEPVEPYTPTYSPFSPRPFESCPDFKRYGGNMEEYLRLYAAMVTQIDAGVGRIIAKLKALRLYDDTLIIYTSDHGDMQGSHGLRNKCYPYEKSAGVPFIVRLPGGRGGEISDTLISGIDIFPSALEVAGKGSFPGLDGKSFIPFMEKHSDTVNDYIISEYLIGSEPWRMIRTPEYKLTVAADSYTPLSLFNMSEDEYEITNLVHDESCSELISSMTEILLSHTFKVLIEELTEVEAKRRVSF